MIAARKTRRLGSASALVSLIALAGCASLGGNINGSFSCRAPDGICAPSSIIDDRALALISGNTALPDMLPAGPYLDDRRSKASPRAIAATETHTLAASADATRTSDKVLRIVFQPYIDERGRLHEASAVHAVVATAEWQEGARATATAIPPRTSQAIIPYDYSLVEAVEHASANDLPPALDPNLPDDALVAAARARKADPVGAIKADVASRLTNTRQAAPASSASAGARREIPVVVPKPTSLSGPSKPIAATPHTEDRPAESASARRTKNDKAPATGLLPKTSSGAEAVARVKGDERYIVTAQSAQSGAEKAAKDAQLPEIKPVMKPTVTATSFPGAVPEEN